MFRIPCALQPLALGWDMLRTQRGAFGRCCPEVVPPQGKLGKENSGRQTLEEEASVSDGPVLLLPEAGEPQECSSIEVIDHPDHLLPPVALPAKGERAQPPSGKGKELGCSLRLQKQAPSPGEPLLLQRLDHNPGDVHGHDAEGKILENNQNSSIMEAQLEKAPPLWHLWPFDIASMHP